jgi:hypothetical protein
MSQTYLPPPAPKGEKEERRSRALVPGLFQDPEKRSIEVGVAGTIIVHLLLLLFLPQIMKNQSSHAALRPKPPNRPFNIQLAPLPKKPPAPAIPKKFVEPNPNANHNTPDNTNNFGAQNQQVAQEKPTPNGKSDMPALEGQKDIKTNQIVTGTLEKQQPQPAVVPVKAAPPKAAVTPPKQEVNPLTGKEKVQGKDPDAYGSANAKVDDSAKAVRDKVEGAKTAPEVANASGAAPAIDPRHPQPRKTLQQHSRPAIFTENKFGTSNIGPTAVDSRWSNYGEYLQRLIEAVQIEWDRILESGRTYPPSGTVSVKFTLDSKGRIAAILDHVTSGTDDHGTAACMAAITNRAPYGAWTPDMIAMLGDSQDMTFTFYYQP